MFRLIVGFAWVATLAACSKQQANNSCPGGDIFLDGACRTVCESDQDCKVVGEVCLSSACLPCSTCRQPPQVTDINGRGLPDGGGHAANHFLNTLVLSGENLDGVAVTLSGGAFAGELLTLCGTPSSTEVEVLLPDSVREDTQYTLTVANQSGSCTASVTLLQGAQGIEGPPGTYTIGSGLNLSGSTLSVVFGQTSGTVAAGDHMHAMPPANGSSAAFAAKSCAALIADYPTTPDGVYWIDPDRRGEAFQTHCDMTTGGGGWTMVANIAPNDGNSVGYGEEDFWTKEMTIGVLVNRFSNDFKSPAAYRLVGTHLMVQSAESGAAGNILGWRRWPFLGGPRSFASLFVPGVPAYSGGTSECDTAASDAVNLGTTNTNDSIIRQGTCLQADFSVRNVGGGWPDLARLTTVGTLGTDNTMGGFATCIDCRHDWQGVNEPYKGLDHAGCAAASCAHTAVCRVGTDCLGNYCTSSYPNTACGAVWNSRFYVR